MPATGMPTQSGPVVELVAQLVDGLLELEHGEQPVDRVLAGRQQRAVDALAVALQVGRARARPPSPRAPSTPRRMREPRGRVGERAQHPRDVAQRRALQPPLGQRPRGLALEVEDHPAAVGEHRLAEVQVAVRADHAAAGAGRRERLEPLAHVLAAAGDLRGRPLVGQLEEDALDLLVDVGHEQRHRLGARLLGRERRVLGLRAERGVQLAGHAAERAQALEQRVGPVRRSPRARAPSRRARRPGTPAGRRASRRSAGPANSYQPASGAMCSKPRAERKRSSSSSGFTPGSTPAERLQDQRLAEHDRRVGLLDADRAGPRRCPRRPARADGAQRKRTRAVLDRDVVALAHAVQQLAARRGVGERVVDRPAVGLERSRAGSSPRPRAAARAAAGRSRASPRRSAPRRCASTSSGGSARSATASRDARSGRPRATWSRTSAGRGPSRAARRRRGTRGRRRRWRRRRQSSSPPSSTSWNQ